MGKRKRKAESELPGARLRRQRVEVLAISLRAMAKLLDISPSYLTDIETDKRAPSEEVLAKIQRHYGIDEATLRAGWSKPESIVTEVASQDSVTAAKVPTFLRTAKNLSPAQWDSLIAQAQKMSATKKGDR